MKWKGAVDIRRGYTAQERFHLIELLGSWGANLFVCNLIRDWGETYHPPSRERLAELEQVRAGCEEQGLELWVAMVPGHARYCMHAADRSRFVQNALTFLKAGADAIYLAADDTHPAGQARENDGLQHARLCRDLVDRTKGRLAAICGEVYRGSEIMEHPYWSPFSERVPEHIPACWVGPGDSVWYRELRGGDVPETQRPLLLFDNFFASDSHDSQRAPIKPYTGRTLDLLERTAGVLINPSYHFAWQIPALQTAMEFLRDPATYRPDRSFRRAVCDLGDRYWEAAQTADSVPK